MKKRKIHGNSCQFTKTHNEKLLLLEFCISHTLLMNFVLSIRSTIWQNTWNTHTNGTSLFHPFCAVVFEELIECYLLRVIWSIPKNWPIKQNEKEFRESLHFNCWHFIQTSFYLNKYCVKSVEDNHLLWGRMHELMHFDRISLSHQEHSATKWRLENWKKSGELEQSTNFASAKLSLFIPNPAHFQTITYWESAAVDGALNQQIFLNP